MVQTVQKRRSFFAASSWNDLIEQFAHQLSALFEQTPFEAVGLFGMHLA
jgi:hypothetical protein